jgi:hypothetical protein
MRHRRRPVLAALALVAVATLSAWGCVKTNNASLPANPLKPTTPTPGPPSTQTVTETFSGTLAVGGSSSFPFNVGGAGQVTGTLTSLGPDSPLLVGLALGVWTGTSCSIAINNSAAGQGAVVTGTISGAGAVCAGVYDTGTLQAAIPFVITVVHP